MRTDPLSSLRRTLRFSRAWHAPSRSLTSSEVLVPLPGGTELIPGTSIRPEGSHDRVWVVLHGMTRPGRAHPELQRFVHALASAGVAVLVPEIREWMELDFAPERAQAVIKACVEWLESSSETGVGGAVLVGFSFGAPQALFAATDEQLAGKIHGVVGWGGYADIERTFRFSFTGVHEWEGTLHRQTPNPYARWVIGKNCIPLSGSFASHIAVARALQRLAFEAGEGRIPVRGPAGDRFRKQLRGELPSADRALFDVFAPESSREPDPSAAEEVIDELVPAIRRALPLVEPIPLIHRLPVATRLLHSRSDQLIPFTETLRLGTVLEPLAPDLSTRLTGLFGHSGKHEPKGRWIRAKENLSFLQSLRGVFDLIDTEP